MNAIVPAHYPHVFFGDDPAWVTPIGPGCAMLPVGARSLADMLLMHYEGWVRYGIADNDNGPRRPRPVA